LRWEVAAPVWEPVGHWAPPLWRRLTSANRLSARLFRDGFRSLAVLPSGAAVGSVPGAIVTLKPGETEFRESLRVKPGMRPMNITASGDGRVFFGEYSRNPHREAVRIFGSKDDGASWEVIYEFQAGVVRHVHNIVEDPWDACFWVLTGDDGEECKVLRASSDWKSVEPVLSGGQQVRSAALLPTAQAVYFATDTQLERNHVYRWDRGGTPEIVGDLPASVFHGCSVGESLLFSTAAEPGKVNTEREVSLFGSADGKAWTALERWEKDAWPMPYFQYGAFLLPSGHNETQLLAGTGLGLSGDDLVLTAWKVELS